MNQLTEEIDQIMNLLEAQLPGSVENPNNQRLERDLEQTMKRYFQSLETAMPQDRLDAIYYKNVKVE